MRKAVVAAVAALLFVAARAEDKARDAKGRACEGPSCQDTAGGGKRSAPPGRDRRPPAKSSERRRAGAGRAPKQEQPKPCEEIKPCPID